MTRPLLKPRLLNRLSASVLLRERVRLYGVGRNDMLGGRAGSQQQIRIEATRAPVVVAREALYRKSSIAIAGYSILACMTDATLEGLSV